MSDAEKKFDQDFDRAIDLALSSANDQNTRVSYTLSEDRVLRERRRKLQALVQRMYERYADEMVGGNESNFWTRWLRDAEEALKSCPKL